MVSPPAVHYSQLWQVAIAPPCTTFDLNCMLKE